MAKKKKKKKNLLEALISDANDSAKAKASHKKGTTTSKGANRKTVAPVTKSGTINSKQAARNIVTGNNDGIGILSDLFESKIGKDVKKAEERIDSAFENPLAKSAVARRAGLTEDEYEKLKPFANITKGTAQSIVGSHVKTVTALLDGGGQDTIDENSPVMKRAGITNEEFGRFKSNVDKASDWASRLIQGGKETVAKEKEGKGALGKFAIDAYEATAGTVSDILTGPLAPVSMFSRSMGSVIDTAEQEGANETQALLYGLSTGSKEAITEKLFSLAGPLKEAFGAGVADDVLGELVKKVTSKMDSKVGRNVVAGTGKIFGTALTEGLEEMLADGLDPVIANTIYANATGTPHSTSAKELLYSGALGAVTGATFGVADVASNVGTGRNLDTGLTDNEEKVVNKEIENRIAEKQKKAAVETEINKVIAENEKTFGKLSESEKKLVRQQVQTQFDSGELDYTTATLSKKERVEIEKQVEEDLKAGYIGIDTIESALAGEKTSRINELRKLLSETTKDAEKPAIETELHQLVGARAQEMKGLLSKENLLQESYRQEALKSESFDRKTTREDTDITKELIESAKSAGMNNTRKMHDLFEYTNKIANDSKTKYAFVNTEQLQRLGHHKEGKTINGLVRVNADGTSKVLINVDSDKAINTIIGHETTHLLEGTAEHKKLVDIVKEYATTKGDYDGRVKEFTKLYEGTNASIENEVTADLVGDYLFTDEQFIHNLSTKEPNVFQKIYDYIKHVYKMATAGSTEARQLEQVKRKFDKAYKQIGKTANNTEKLSISTNLKSELQQVRDNTFDAAKSEVEVGETSEFLKTEIGAEPIKVLMPPHKAYKAMVDMDTAIAEGRYDGDEEIHYHDLGVDGLIEALEAAEDPIVAFVSLEKIDGEATNRDDHIVLVTDKKNSSDEYIVVVQAVDVKGRLDNKIKKTNKVITAYGKEKIQNYIERAVKADKILFADKKRSHLVVGGTELLTFSGRNFDFTDNINNFWANVNYLHGKTKPKAQKDTGNNTMLDAFNKAKEKKQAKEDKEIFSFSGESALTANSDLLKRAKDMAWQKVDSESIRQETGWFKGYDGKWRFEIDDSEFEIDTTSTSGRLGDLMKHPKLFEAYPTLEDVKVSFENIISGQSATYFPATDEIVLDSTLKSDELKSTLIHEVQHAIQHREGFASGASVSYWNRQLQNGYDGRYKSAKKKQSELMDKYLAYVEEDRQFVLDMEELDAMRPDVPRGKIDWDTLEQVEEDPVEWQIFDKRRDELEDKYGQDKVFDFIDLKYKQEAVKEEGKRTADDLYYYTAGEIEARDVQDRRLLSAEQRRNERPDIDNENVVFADRYSLSESNLKAKQLDIILKSNPANDDYHTWIRSVDDIKTFEETLQDSDWAEYVEEGFNPDYTGDMVQEALSTGKITVYSSYPIENGIFVSPSRMEAESYSGSGNVYSKEVNLSDVAWVDPTQGQYAKVEERYSLSDNIGRKLSKGQQERFKNSQARDENGNLLRLYHQTGNDFTVFNTRHEGAGTRDSGTPYGIFLKPTPNDIGLKGKKQMALYANIENPLVAKNREELDRILKADEEYAAVRSELDNLDVVYQAKFDDAKKAFTDFLVSWRKEHPDAQRAEIYNDSEFNKIFEAEENIVQEWTAKADELSVRSKELITAYLKKQGYDGIILEEDAGSFGRKTKAYIALDPEQVKSVDNLNPTDNPDIRYSVSNNIAPINGRDISNKTRKELQKELLAGDSNYIVKALEKAKNIPMALMNNTDTIRNNEIVLGREAGKKVNEAIFQKAIDNEARSIYWQNKQRADIKALGIKARSKESAAVQKYGEGEYVNEFGDLVQYGEADLMMEFPNEKTQEKIKEAARIIKLKYEHYIDQANGILTGLGFDPIPKRKDYMRHFQELNDVFSKNGLPFNPQNMKEHVLPTDINGLTEFWSPQKNFFANMQPRKGLRTTLDAVTGIDGYIGGIANLIFHTEDIQRGRAYEGMIRENFGEERGWDILESLPEDQQAARAELIGNNHLSNYAAWVHEWTNNLAGKKNKIDRSVEAMFGRKGFTVLDTIRKQVGANMIGFNVASSLTNLISPLQAMAKTNKIAVMKGTVDTFRNIVSKDGFVDKNAFLTARFGTDMLSKTKWEKATDAAYVFMKGVDHFSSNLIVRSKYNELVKKGMSEKEAHKEAGKFAARIMGDRTKGANAQLYNSKMVGILSQFQLEVNNQLYSMFYDTYHDSKENAKGSAAKTAAGMTFVLGQLFAFTHIFGKAFESVAGYNPTFDVIDMIAKLFGIGEDDEEEKTFAERAEAVMQQLVNSLPYSSILTGGRIPIGQALPIKQLFEGKDDYGNEKSRWETLKETAPYYLLPGGYGQIKKSIGGVEMFVGDKPVSGSYTDSGNLRFPVEETPMNIVHAAIFGKWANKNAQDYIDNERLPLKEKQIQEYKDLKLPIKDYWEIREGLKGLDKNKEKFDYIAGLDIPVRQKNILINNAVNRDERIDMTDYDDYGSYEEFELATEKPEEYAIAKAIGFSNYMIYSKDLDDLRADKDKYGKSIRNIKKAKVIDYINGLDIDYEAKLILYKKQYKSDDAHNQEIIDYLNSRADISYQDMESILTELGFTVTSDGKIYW